MPKQILIEKAIPNLYKKSALNLLMFGYVRGVTTTIHTISIEQAIMMFMEDFHLDIDEYNLKSAMTTYNRTQKDLITLKKSNI